MNNAVIFGLSETAENLLQEGGRPMRGSRDETAGKQGYAFVFLGMFELVLKVVD